MAVTTWRTDPAHTGIEFSTKHMMVTTVRGTFTAVDGTLLLDEADPAASSGRFTVDAASLSTGVEQRDAHLRGPDFLDVEAYPLITFQSTAVEPRRGGEYRVAGDLTIRGTTRRVTFDVEDLGRYQGLAGAHRAGFLAVTKLNREDWGLAWNVALETGGWLVGKEIRLQVDLAVERVAAASDGEPVGADTAVAAVAA